MGDLRLYLFGTPRIEYQGKTVKIERRKALGLVAYLVLAEGSQSRDVLATLLWPNQDDEHARSSLRSTLRALSTPITADWLQAERTTLALKPGALRVDVLDFVDLLKQGQSHDHSPDILCADCVEYHKQAVELCTGDFLAGFHLADSPDFESWQATQREWLRLELAGALERLSQHYAAEQRYQQAITHARSWLALDTLHESAHRQLMRLYADSGQKPFASINNVLNCWTANWPPRQKQKRRSFSSIFKKIAPVLVQTAKLLLPPTRAFCRHCPRWLLGAAQRCRISNSGWVWAAICARSLLFRAGRESVRALR